MNLLHLIFEKSSGQFDVVCFVFIIISLILAFGFSSQTFFACLDGKNCGN